jgi:mannose-6-phosphate isomerase
MTTEPRLDAPLRTAPVFRHYIWGGTRLGPLLGKPLGPEGTLAESWEVGDDALVDGGPWAGRTLREVDEATNGALRGEATSYPNARLPLLIKLSDSAADLSVQIHPTDQQALRDDPERGYPGKAEMYVIIEAEPDAGVYWGLRTGVTSARLAEACRTGQGVRDLINFVPVKAGDILYSPAGVVHALGKGIVYCEVQENSDITYRLYDWGRMGTDGKPRELHIERGLAVLSAHPPTTPYVQPLKLPMEGGQRRILCACPHFAVESIELNGTVDLGRTRPIMRAVVVLEGEVTLRGDSDEVVVCRKGQSAVFPASLKQPTATGNASARFLLAYLPDLEADIIAPLRAAGYDRAAIVQLGDVGPITG